MWPSVAAVNTTGIAREAAGVISMNGPNSSKFVTNYGFFVSLSAYNNTAVVTCTSCHNQHLMNVVKRHAGPEVWSAHGLSTRRCSSFVLPTIRPAPPGFEPDGTVLPSVPWRRSQRIERRHGRHSVLTFNCGERAISPLFLERGTHEAPISIAALLLLGLSTAKAQVASHPPTQPLA